MLGALQFQIQPSPDRLSTGSRSHDRFVLEAHEGGRRSAMPGDHQRAHGAPVLEGQFGGEAARRRARRVIPLDVLSLVEQDIDQGRLQLLRALQATRQGRIAQLLFFDHVGLSRDRFAQ